MDTRIVYTADVDHDLSGQIERDYSELVAIKGGKLWYSFGGVGQTSTFILILPGLMDPQEVLPQLQWRRVSSY